MWPKVLTYPDPPPCGYPRGAEPFLAAIIADRDDDARRLVFADWLQEQGEDERAEFIRLQCELHRVDSVYDWPASRDALPPDWRVKYERQRALSDKNRAAWIDALPPGILAGQTHPFRRGFLALATTTPSEWSRYGERIRAWLPLESLWIRDDNAVGYAELLLSPTLFELDELTLSRAGNAELRAMAGSAALDSLGELTVIGRNLGGTVETPVIRALFGSPRLARLWRLRVQLDRAGDALGFVIAGSAHLRNLRTLYLADAMHADSARELFDSPNVANVTDLVLPDNPMGDAGIRALVRSKYLTRLESLDLPHTNLTSESARLLAAWPGLRSVSSLVLSGNGLTAADADLILSSPHALKLTRNGLGI